jgi:hypothetical protein
MIGGGLWVSLRTICRRYYESLMVFCVVAGCGKRIV